MTEFRITVLTDADDEVVKADLFYHEHGFIVFESRPKDGSPIKVGAVNAASVRSITKE